MFDEKSSILDAVFYIFLVDLISTDLIVQQSFIEVTFLLVAFSNQLLYFLFVGIESASLD